MTIRLWSNYKIVAPVALTGTGKLQRKANHKQSRKLGCEIMQFEVIQHSAWNSLWTQFQISSLPCTSKMNNTEMTVAYTSKEGSERNYREHTERWLAQNTSSTSSWQDRAKSLNHSKYSSLCPNISSSEAPPGSPLLKGISPPLRFSSIVLPRPASLQDHSQLTQRCSHITPVLQTELGSNLGFLCPPPEGPYVQALASSCTILIPPSSGQ